MKVETVEVHSQPMLYLTRRTAMNPAEIGRSMAEMFETMGQFIGQKSVPVIGPPMAIYHDHAAGSMAIDLGFPVAAAGTSLAAGDVKAGETPGGKAVKVIHHGPYDRLRDTYGELEAYFRTRGMTVPAKSWEVYLNEPGAVPDADLATEIYFPVAD